MYFYINEKIVFVFGTHFQQNQFNWKNQKSLCINIHFYIDSHNEYQFYIETAVKSNS